MALTLVYPTQLQADPEQPTTLAPWRRSGGEAFGSGTQPLRWRTGRWLADPSVPGQARALATATLWDWKLGELTDRVCLCTSELVTNAVVHPRRAAQADTRATRARLVWLELILRPGVTGSHLGVYVTDDDPHMYAGNSGFDGDAVSGRGLGIVKATASAFGVRRRTGHKTVWCSFEL